MKPHIHTQTIISGTAGSGKTQKLIEMLADIVETYEDKKVLLVVREESASTIERMLHMDCPEDTIRRIEVVEYNPHSHNHSECKGYGKEFIERFIFEQNFDVVAFDDSCELMHKIIEFDISNEISREYLTTVPYQRIAQRQRAYGGCERPHIPDYSLGA